MRSVFVLALAAACGGKLSAGECRRQSDDLVAFLQTIDHDQSLYGDGDVTLVKRDGLSPAPESIWPSVTITRTGLVFHDRTPTVDELKEQLLAVRAELATMFPGPRPPVVQGNPYVLRLAIDEAAPWHLVVDAIHAGHAAEFDTALFVFALTPATAAPPPTWVDGKVAAIMREDPSERATRAAALMAGIVKSCPALTRAFESAASIEGDKAELLIEALGPALVECGCTIDMLGLRSMMWHLLGNPHPTTWVQQHIDPTGKQIALPAETPWRSAQVDLTADRIPSPTTTTLGVWPTVQGQ